MNSVEPEPKHEADTPITKINISLKYVWQRSNLKYKSVIGDDELVMGISIIPCVCGFSYLFNVKVKSEWNQT